MQICLSEILSVAAIAISLATFVFTVIKAKSDRKERFASKRTVVLAQLSSTMFLLENIMIEYKKWLGVETRLWPDQENELKERSNVEQTLVENMKDDLQKFYDEISEFSKKINTVYLDEVLASINHYHMSMEAIRNRITHAKGRLTKDELITSNT